MVSRISMPFQAAGHTAFFDGKMLAEVLPEGTYRFTRELSQDCFIIILSNPSIGKARVEVYNRDGKVKPPGPLGILPGIFAEGKALLQSNGYAVEKDRFISDKLAGIEESVEKDPGVEPSSVQDGECVVAPLTGLMDGSTGFVAFKAKNATAISEPGRFECDSPVVCKKYSADRVVLDQGGNEYKVSWWKASGKYLSLPEPDFNWLKKTLDYTSGGARFEEGPELFRSASEAFPKYKARAKMKEWKAEKRLVPPGVDSSNTLGGVAI